MSSGNAGEITITATESVMLSGTTVEERGEIRSDARLGATGQVGRVVVDTPVLQLRNGAQIAVNGGDGDGGSVMVRANLIEAIGTSSDGIFPSAFFTVAEGNGPGGNLTIETERLLVSDGAQFVSRTDGDGDAGNITVYASESVDVIGTNATGTSSSGLFTSGLLIGSTREEIGGNGGELVIETGRLRVAEGGRLQASALGSGDAGSITIRARSVEVSDAFVNFTDTVSGVLVSVDEEATGNGGQLRIDAERLHIFDGGQVIASSLGDGNAGNIILNVNDIEVTGISEDGQFPSRIAAFSEGNSPAGFVTITSNNLRVRDGAEISVSARGNGDNAKAGNLDITASSIVLDQATLSAEVSAGDQGNINLDSQLILMGDRSNITTNAKGAATGGNITIDTDLLVALENSDITANAENSFGGQVFINALGIFGTEFREQKTPDSDITASSERGASFSGTVEINAPYSDPSAGLFELPETFVNPKLLVATGCGTDDDNQFTQFGRGGLPTDPTQPLVGETLWMDLRPLPRHTARRRKNRDHAANAANAANPVNSRRSRIVEANRWIVNNDGVVELVADSVQSSPFISWFQPYYCVR
ncbi:MAG: S-layer family protein [Moorea sp. SIO3C2]|nr:S-layer family protein [Moorena sp. SIO3C2]